MYVCKVCNLVSENKGSYMNHCKTHRSLDESNPYVCECGFSTTNAQAYSGHRGRCKVAHPDRTFESYKIDD